MGGCCCLPRSELNRTPVHSYCHQAWVEHQLSSSRRGTESAISPGLLAHGNLDTSSPDTYRAPPTPLPHDIDLVCSQTLPQTGSKIDLVPLNESQPLGENISGSNFEGCINLESNHKKKSDSEHGSPKVAENKNTKLSVAVISSTEEEDVCPTCLEEYDADNPCITTKCKHHFHLSCILEWMERSDTCPICDQELFCNLGRETRCTPALPLAMHAESVSLLGKSFLLASPFTVPSTVVSRASNTNLMWCPHTSLLHFDSGGFTRMQDPAVVRQISLTKSAVYILL